MSAKTVTTYADGYGIWHVDGIPSRSAAIDALTAEIAPREWKSGETYGDAWDRVRAYLDGSVVRLGTAHYAEGES